jgi:hypothetical protein
MTATAINTRFRTNKRLGAYPDGPISAIGSRYNVFLIRPAQWTKRRTPTFLATIQPDPKTRSKNYLQAYFCFSPHSPAFTCISNGCPTILRRFYGASKEWIGLSLAANLARMLMLRLRAYVPSTLTTVGVLRIVHLASKIAGTSG